jgi:hypothetical protein
MGRQVVGLNRSRYIGAQDFRPAMQAVDGASTELPLIAGSYWPHVTVQGAFVEPVSAVSARSRDDDVGLLRARWTRSRGNTLLAWPYWHDG